jgi:large repetitive protein
MTWSGFSMTAGRIVARSAAAVVLVLVLCAVGLAGSAIAAEPQIAIAQPHNGEYTKQPLPIFTGTSTDPLNSVTLDIYLGASATGTPIQSVTLLAPVELGPEEATWEITPEASLAQGQYTVVAEQANAQLETGVSPPVTFTIDTTPPTVTINAVPTPSKDAEPKLGGAGGVAPGDDSSVSVAIYDGTSIGGTLAASGSAPVEAGSWSYQAPHLPDGTYTAQASQSDEAGNLGTSGVVTFTVDTTPPVVTIDAVPTPSKDAEPKLGGAGGVAPGDDSSVSVAIYDGTSVGGTLAASGSAPVKGGSWSYQAPHLSDGTYTARASQSDEAGNLGTSAAVTFTVDTTPPAMTIATPRNGEVLEVSRPRFSGSAGIASGDLPLITVKIYEGPSPSGKLLEKLELTPADGEWTTGASGPVLAKGIYTAVAEQSDDVGNTTARTTTFTIDTSSPVVTIERAAFVTRGSELVTGPRPSFSGSGAIGGEDSKIVVVHVYSGTSTSATAVRTVEATLSGGAWKSEPVAELEDGTYTVQAEQKYTNATVHAGVSEAVTFTVDADAPRVTITSPVSGASTSSASQIISGSASTGEGDLPAVTVELYAGSSVVANSPIEAVTVQASSGSWSAALGGLSTGTYTVQAEQSDDVGNTAGSEPVTFSIVATSTPEATGPAPPPPSASFKWIPSAPNTGEPITLISTATDPTAAITGYAWAPAGNGVFAAGESSLTTSFATPGPHVVQLRVTDGAGASSVATETIPVSAAPVPLMQPFPVVRMAGSYNGTGADITVLTVLAPVGAKVTVTCRGPHCPAKSQAVLATAAPKSGAGTVVVSFKRFERRLRAGVVLEIWVSKGGEIGKFTRFTIHRGKSPSRIDECVNPAGNTPIVCPS